MIMSVFATSINCIDGRVQTPISEWIKKNHNVDFVDVVSEPGSDAVLSTESSPEEEKIKQKVMISINAHKSELVFVSGHHECAANPVSKEDHIRHIQQAVARVNSWGLPAKVVGLWVNDSWNVEQVS